MIYQRLALLCAEALECAAKAYTKSGGHFDVHVFLKMLEEQKEDIHYLAFADSIYAGEFDDTCPVAWKHFFHSLKDAATALLPSYTLSAKKVAELGLLDRLDQKKSG